MHDKNGKAIHVGDEVTIRCKVESTSSDAVTCNISVRTVEKQTSGHSAGDVITLNANQVERVGPSTNPVQEAAERGASGQRG